MTIDATTLWIIAGVILLILEMFTSTFVLIFVSLGCFSSGILSFFHSFENAYTLQFITCAVITVCGMFLLRKPLQSRLLKTITLNADIGKEIQVDHSIRPHSTDRITYQGTQWHATNLDAEELKSGDRVHIVGIDGNTLLIRKIL